MQRKIKNPILKENKPVIKCVIFNQTEIIDIVKIANGFNN